MIFSTVKGKLIALVCLFLLVFSVVTTLRQCAENDSKAVIITTNEDKLNSEITAYRITIETLERHIDSLENIITNTDKQRYENRIHTPHKSTQQHYGDLSKRYADKKPDR